MKSKTLKVLLLSATAILLVIATVLATMAYLTSSSAVSNVFTVGNVKLNMTETKVNSNGTPVTDRTNRTDTNSYHLVPGASYLKDPIIEVGATSDESYLFVRVRNDLKTIECPGYVEKDGTQHVCAHNGTCKTILEQLIANGWQEIERAENNVDAVFVYVGAGNVVADTGTNYDNTLLPYATLVGNKRVDGQRVAENYEVFENFTLASEVPGLESFGGARVAIVAYAIQANLTGAGEKGSPEAYKNAWQYIKNELPFVV